MIDPAISPLRSLWITTAPVAALPTPCPRSRRCMRPPFRISRGRIVMSSHVRSRCPLTLIAVLLSVAVVGLATLVDPPAAEAQRKKVVNIAAKEPDTLDPHSSTLGQSQAIARFMFRGLTRFAIKDGKVTTAEVEPDLAESWTLSPDGTLWTFKLRKGVQFHKGFGELTAEDVKFSFERQINRAPGTRFGVNLGVIKSIEVVDPHTVQIALKSFDAIFLLRMVGYQQGYIVSKKAAEKFGDQFKWNPVGTGPFYFERHSPRDKIVLKAFDKYHVGPPGYFGHIPMEFPEYNPEKAKKLLAEAGHPNGFTIKNYFISKSFFYPKVMTLAQEQLKKVGINVELQVVEHATFHENIRKNLNPFVLYGGTRITDADPWLSLFFDSKEIPDGVNNKGTNFAHYKNIDD